MEDVVLLNPTEFAWAMAESITQKTPKEIKVIVDDVEYPSLGRDDSGYVIHLSGPRKVRENLMSLHGVFFDNDQTGKGSLWRVFRASVYHLCLHAAFTDYSIYRNLVSTRDRGNNVAMFSVSMAEDFALRGCMRSMWPGLILDTAYANYFVSVRFRDLSLETDLGVIAAATLLSYSMIGRPVVAGVGHGLDAKLEALHAILVGYSNDIADAYSMRKAKETDENSNNNNGVEERVTELKVSSAESIMKFFEEESLVLPNVYTPPYTDSHGPNDLFTASAIESVGEEEENEGRRRISRRRSKLEDAFNELSIGNLSDQKVKEDERAVEAEAGNILGSWEYSLLQMKRVADLHRELDARTHFEDFGFPVEDYAEFVRARTRLIGPIRRILEHLQMVKSTTDEVTGKESGYIDIPAAIQVVATRSERNDVFIREEEEKKSEAWAILIDASKSLEGVAGELKDIGVCLAEVANGMMPSANSWGCYAFNEEFYVLKDFTESYSNVNKGRIGGLKTGVKTYLPDAVRTASLRLQKTTEDIKVLLVVSDGFPLGYEAIDQELVSTIEKVSKGGIMLVGLGIGSSSIAKYFKSNCVINNTLDLMKSFVKTYFQVAGSF